VTRPGDRVRRAFWELRTEGEGAGREALAIGLGVFIGCSPFYGFHLLLCWGLGWCLGLNRLKMYLAAHVSNPVFAPLLILGELQVGAWIRRDRLHALNLETVRTLDPWTFGADIVIGSLVVGAVLGGCAALAVYLSSRRTVADPCFAPIARRAADRYILSSITAWEFARGKLRGDPLYRTVLSLDRLPAGGTLVDVGCGQGLMLAVFAEARLGSTPEHCQRPPAFDRLIGLESRARVARMAERALQEHATIVCADARSLTDGSEGALLTGGASVVLFFDVLHMLPSPVDQERLVAWAIDVLTDGGLILVREPDAAAGWQFTAVRVGNRLKAVFTGNWRQGFHFRTAAEWRGLFEQSGCAVEELGTSDGTPFANVLFVVRKRAARA
jgi:uncharacterized protein (DUF2062 family)/SAM-dependent methyltransferase